MISDLVIIDPKWLIGIMQIIVELQDNCPFLSAKEVDKVKRGEVSLEVLTKLWSDVTKSTVINAKKLTIVLQAYCLIHSADSEADSKAVSLDSEADSLDSKAVSLDSEAVSLDSKAVSLDSKAVSLDSEAVSLDSETVSTNSEASQCFIIPSMLPQLSNAELEKISKKNLPWIDFYFDFEKYLPVEVYHRLLCMFVAEPKKPGIRTHRTLSKYLCCFHMIHDCYWKIELEDFEHRIKISVAYVKSSVCIICTWGLLKPFFCYAGFRKGS